jgi:surfactin synthase thioesterase subunit
MKRPDIDKLTALNFGAGRPAALTQLLAAMYTIRRPSCLAGVDYLKRLTGPAGQEKAMTIAAIHNPWMPFLKPNPKAALRLFCFPYAGGNALIYRNWQDALPVSVEVCPVQIPGRGSRLAEPPIADLTLLVNCISEGIHSFLDKPFAFFGHSMGAMVSFELARCLRRQGLPQPIALVVSGRRAPQTPSTSVPSYTGSDEALIEDLRRLDGTPKEVLEHPELLQMVLPILRADFEACHTYKYYPEPPLDCAILAFGGLYDKEETRHRMFGWREQTSRDFDLWMLPGNHFFLQTCESALLARLSWELRRLQR